MEHQVTGSVLVFAGTEPDGVVVELRDADADAMKILFHFARGCIGEGRGKTCGQWLTHSHIIAEAGQGAGRGPAAPPYMLP